MKDILGEAECKMTKLTDKKSVQLLTILSWMIYFSSYVTRINYGAIIVEFVASEGVMKSAASIITSVLFVTYGVGQLLSGFLGDRISPRKLITVGLTIAVACNLLMPLCSPQISVMAVIWGLNGLAQALMWPPLVKILTSALTMEDYARIVPGISTSSACATIAIYLISPLIIGLSGWKMVFYVCAATAFAAVIIWTVCSKKLLSGVDFNLGNKNKATKQTEQAANSADKALWLLMPVILLTISVQGMLRDGITTWMPTYISETFNIGSSISILTGVALPVFHMIVSLCTYGILKKMKYNVFNCMAMFFSVAAVLLLVLNLFGTSSMLVATVLIAMCIGAVHGINTLQTCYLPTMFKGQDKVSFLAGLLNSATYVGSALSTYLFAIISEQWGWNATLLSWLLAAAAGLLLTLVCTAALKKNK